MKIKKEQRDKLAYYLTEFYKRYPTEPHTVFKFVRFFKARLRQNKDAWLGVTGDTGCLTSETKIKGYDQTLQELYNQGRTQLKTKSFDFVENKEVDSESDLVFSGRKLVYELTTEKGKKVMLTQDHTLFVIRSGRVVEISVKDIKKGDELFIK